jgi:hypothetical protein
MEVNDKFCASSILYLVHNGHEALDCHSFYIINYILCGGSASLMRPGIRLNKIFVKFSIGDLMKSPVVPTFSHADL